MSREPRRRALRVPPHQQHWRRVERLPGVPVDPRFQRRRSPRHREPHGALRRPRDPRPPRAGGRQIRARRHLPRRQGGCHLVLGFQRRWQPGPGGLLRRRGGAHLDPGPRSREAGGARRRSPGEGAAGGGGFQPLESYPVGPSPKGLVLADLDGDGRLDCAVVNHDSKGISILWGAGDPRGPTFRRGDADSDGQASITDAVVVLQSLFCGAGPPECEDAADSNDDGLLNLTDPVFLLMFLFCGGVEPPSPGFRECGRDTTGDLLADCASGCPE
jgi:hypothetical protein